MPTPDGGLSKAVCRLAPTSRPAPEAPLRRVPGQPSQDTALLNRIGGRAVGRIEPATWRSFAEGVLPEYNDRQGPSVATARSCA